MCLTKKHVLLFDFINLSNFATEHEHRHEIRTKHTKKQVTLKYYFFFIFHNDLLKTCGDRISLPLSLIFCFLFLHSFTACSIATLGRVSSDFLGNSKSRSCFHQNTWAFAHTHTRQAFLKGLLSCYLDLFQSHSC